MTAGWLSVDLSIHPSIQRAEEQEVFSSMHRTFHQNYILYGAEQRDKVQSMHRHPWDLTQARDE